MFCLKVATDPSWVACAANDVAAVLVDHAHCEMKAASNALSLAARHSNDFALVRALTDLAKEEIEHFQQVVAILEARAIPLGTPPVDAYAANLRAAVAKLPRWPSGPLVDRLLVGALIEARSCERFKLLAGALADSEPDLAAFYRDLFTVEARHYRTFVDLARAAAGAGGQSADKAIERLDRLAEAEAEIVCGLAAQHAPNDRATVHG